MSIDWVAGGGDELLTRDTRTGLDWLDVPATRRLSVLEVLAGAGGWTSNGFRYATLDEIRDLLASFQLAEGLIGSVPDVAMAQLLITLLGHTYENNPPSPGNPFGQKTLLGVTGDRYPQIGDSRPAYIYGNISVSDQNGQINFGGQYFLDSQDSAVGSFLIRSSPVTQVNEPNVAFLFWAGLGLIAFGGIRRRRSKN